MWITDCDPYTEKRLGFQSKRKRPVSESFTTYRTFTSKLQTGQYAAAILTDSGRIKNEFRPWSLRAHFSNFSNALSGETEKVSPKTFLKASWLLSCFARCEEKTLGQRISAAIGKARRNKEVLHIKPRTVKICNIVVFCCLLHSKSLKVVIRHHRQRIRKHLPKI